MKFFFIAIPVLLMMGLVACQTSSQKMTTAKSSQQKFIQFDDAEVPYFVVTKKNGKLTAEIVNVPARVSEVSQVVAK